MAEQAKSRASGPRRNTALERRVQALQDILLQIYGPERLVLKAGKLQALKGLRSEDIGDKVLALEKLILDDPSLNRVPTRREITPILNRLENALADVLARRSLEEDLEKRINERMQERHDEYVRDIRSQILKEDSGPETPETLKKLARLIKLDEGGLKNEMASVVRPNSLAEVVGQDGSIRQAVAHLSSPFPQHILFYGPPGVGKTTVARLALDVARKAKHSAFLEEAPFVEVDGATLRWDPREVTNPLLGSVHDPIYQGARRELAEGGIPEPKTGLVTDAHGGILFIDEIGEMDPILQNKLLKVLEDKRVQFESPYYDPGDPNVPQYVRKLFDEGAPADFILIGATTRSPDEISPALRSRCVEIFFDPLTPPHIEVIAQNAAARLEMEIAPDALGLISRYTLEGRRAVGLILDAYAILYLETGKKPTRVDAVTVRQAVAALRLSAVKPHLAKETPMVGRSLGLAVAGFRGLVIEIEVSVLPARESGRGQWRFNETAGSMARDSVFNAGAVLRQLLGRDLGQYDVYVNVVGGGNIDGPSAGTAIFLALYSAMTEIPLKQNVAITGELSLSGRLKPVGGIPEKILGALQANVETVIIPVENADDVPPMTGGPKILPMVDVREVLAVVTA